MKVKRIDHINIVVVDLDSAISFFESLGFTKRASKRLSGDWMDRVVGLKDAKAKFASMELESGQTVIELLTYYQPPDTSVDQQNLANKPGYRHIALEVDDVNKWYQKMESDGFECFSPVQDVPNYKDKRLFYSRGPEGIIIEFTEYGN